MKRITFALALVASVFGSHAANAAPDWGAEGRALGKEGAVQPGGVYQAG